MTSDTRKQDRTQGIIFLFAAWVWFGLALRSALDGEAAWGWACIAVGIASAITAGFLLRRSRRAR